MKKGRWGRGAVARDVLDRRRGARRVTRAADFEGDAAEECHSLHRRCEGHRRCEKGRAEGGGDGPDSIGGLGPELRKRLADHLVVDVGPKFRVWRAQQKGAKDEHSVGSSAVEGAEW